jgi:hypothetical protein
VGVLTSFLVGCGSYSSYVPVRSPRLSMVHDGGLVYVRDGKKFEGGIFGGAIEEAVSGNPHAEEYAREFKTGLATSFAFTMLSAAGIVGGTTLLSLGDGARAPYPSLATPGAITIGAGVVALVVAVVVGQSTVPHLTDAINAYNDGLLASPPAVP